MFVWARIPEQYRSSGSMEFSKKLLVDAKVAVSPGIGFGDHGDQHVRFSLIENEERSRQAPARDQADVQSRLENLGAKVRCEHADSQGVSII